MNKKLNHVRSGHDTYMGSWPGHGYYGILQGEALCPVVVPSSAAILNQGLYTNTLDCILGISEFVVDYCSADWHTFAGENDYSIESFLGTCEFNFVNARNRRNKNRCPLLFMISLQHRMIFTLLVIYWNILREPGQYHSSWCPGSSRRQVISNNSIDYVGQKGCCIPWWRISR